MEFSLYGKLPSSAAITSIRLERREPARNRLRFYTITVTRTLFDRWAVIREWGRIGQPGRAFGSGRRSGAINLLLSMTIFKYKAR